ncbi:MAG: DNA (cytosine-5-)-methyltransferase [Firmicutes bacterium]|nr:DNA (cytosine-5-)-methyltransferase [Bacillota bacterium]
MSNNKVKFIDLFAGLGGIRLGFEQAFKDAGLETQCVLTSEIKPAAINALTENFGQHPISGDITTIDASTIPNFDFLLAGFPCQAFSVAGKQRGFQDTRGTLFFDVERILEEKKPYGFILENVEGLVTHDKESEKDKIGKTLKTILHILKDKLGYKVNWGVLDAQSFGLAQKRNRIYIIGTLDTEIPLNNFIPVKKTFGDIMEQGLPTIPNKLSEKLFEKYKPQELYGKAIKDKRGGISNIHSWDVELRGHVTDEEKELLNSLMRERRKKRWAEIIGIDWMDGMPLTTEQIRTFYDSEMLEHMLEDLVEKGYLVYEHPKKKIKENDVYERVPDKTKPKGYNIVTGKLSFDFTRILSPNNVTPTLVAMDMATLGVLDNGGLRHLSLREGLRLFGFPEWYTLENFNKSERGKDMGYDLLGNTVCVPVIQSIANRLAISYSKRKKC